MANATTDPRFFAALQQALQTSPLGPINSSTFLQDRDLGMEKAGMLLSYQNYLAQARSWKAARKSVPQSFEREVQAQAAQALSDTRDLAASMLRMTSQMKQAGQLDRMIDSTIAGIQAGGPARISDLWAQVSTDTVKQALKNQGLTDDLFAVINNAMSKVDGRLYLQDAKLAMDVTAAEQEPVRTVTFSRSAAGPPRSLHDLLTRGQFERLVYQFSQPGAAQLDTIPTGPVPGTPSAIEVADLVLAGSVRSVQLVAQHKRKLEDTGLATYAGSDPGTVAAIIFISGITLMILGSAIASECNNGHIKLDSDLCKVCFYLFLLGLLATFAVGAGLVGVPIAIFVIHIEENQEPHGRPVP